MKRPRNKSKALMWQEYRSGNEVLVKSYRSAGILFRLYGRLTLLNEARAYERLAGVRGIGTCYGLRDKETLELEFIPGQMLSSLKRGGVSAVVFEKLEQILEAMRQRGVANGDIHQSNVLITEREEVYLIDFAHALVATDPRHPGMLVRLFMQLDRYAVERLKARYFLLPEPAPTGAFGVIYRTLSGIKKLHWRKRSQR